MIEVKITHPFMVQDNETKHWYKQKEVQMKFEDILQIPITVIEDSFIEQEIGVIDFCIHKASEDINEKIAKLKNISDKMHLQDECKQIMKDAVGIVMLEYYKFDRKKEI